METTNQREIADDPVTMRYFDLQIQKDTCIFLISEPFLCGAVIGEIFRIEVLNSIRDFRPQKLVFDFSCVKGISSSLISELLRIRKNAFSNDCTICFVAVPKLIESVFRTVGLAGHYFPITDSMADALGTEA